MAASYLYGYASPTPRRTLAQMEQVDTWRLLDPEFKRRLVAIFDASRGTLGFGGGWRSSAQQEALFRSRYHVVAYVTGIRFDGSYWVKNAGVAASTPPFASYHEATTPDGRALAADLIGDLSFLDRHGADYGLRDLSDVNNEPWHAQPKELPTARRNYLRSMHPLKPVRFPNELQPIQRTETDDMALLIAADDGDPAVLAVTGVLGSFVRNMEALNVATLLGTVETEIHRVPRSTYKAITLVGLLPDYGATPPTRPTVASDFAAVVV